MTALELIKIAKCVQINSEAFKFSRGFIEKHNMLNELSSFGSQMIKSSRPKFTHITKANKKSLGNEKQCVISNLLITFFIKNSSDNIDFLIFGRLKYFLENLKSID